MIFKFRNKDIKHSAIGFKNSAGGYELRSELFKLSSSPKYVTYITNETQNGNRKKSLVSHGLYSSDEQQQAYKNEDKNILSQSSVVEEKNASQDTLHSTSTVNVEEENERTNQPKSIAVFEGFFDFLTYLTIHQNQQQLLTHFLILNSLAFFERSLLLMEKHEHVHLYLDNDEAGKKCLDMALKRSAKYKDESGLYKGYKDLNDWVMNFGKLEHKQSLKRSSKMGLP